MRRWFALGTKVALTAALLYLIARSVDLAEVGAQLSRVRTDWCLAGVALFGVTIGLGALRWRLAAEPLSAALPLRHHLRLNLVSHFFNQALPSTLGGDAARSWMARKVPGGLRGAIYAVLADRLAGFIGILVLIAAGLPWSLAAIADVRGQIALLLLLSAGVAAAVFYLLAGLLPAALAARWTVAGTVRAASRSGWRSLCRLRPGAAIFALALMGHGFTILSTWALGRSLGIDPGLGNLAALLPAIVLFSMIPITVAGWGLREGAMVAALAPVGIPPAAALSLSILIGLMQIAWGLVGGLMLLGSRSRPSGIYPATGAEGGVGGVEEGGAGGAEEEASAADAVRGAAVSVRASTR